MLRRIVVLAAFGLAAQVAVACGRILPEDLDEGPDDGGEQAEGAAPSPDGGEPGADGSSTDGAAPNVPDVVSECRPVLFDDFEAADWNEPSNPVWTSAAAAPASYARVRAPRLVKNGDAAVSFQAPVDAFVHLAHDVSGDCALTVDLWYMHASGGASPGTVVFELTAQGRTRLLRHFAPFLSLDYENPDPAAGGPVDTAEVSKQALDDVYHHVLLRYEPNGAMTVDFNGARTVTLTPAMGAPLAPATRIRFGMLGATGTPATPPASTMVLFDDVLVY